MKKAYIQVPGKEHLSNYQSYIESLFPAGSFVLDKKLTGCGATTMFLCDPYPTILCSPRIELMRCKAESPEFKGIVHQFRAADDRTTAVLDLQNHMMQYIQKTELCIPFSNQAPKILVSYDSFKHVAERLAQEGILNKFRIVVDEFQTLFTDAAYRGDVEIEFLRNLSYNNQIVFLSATPYMEKYLDQVVLFRNLPLVVLQWCPEAFHTANVQTVQYYRNSIRRTATRIIDRFRTEGAFERKMFRGVEILATEAVFFLNDVQQIINIIKDNGLTPDDTNVLCARTEENIQRLAKIEDAAGNKLGFTIGHAPGKGVPHKPYTFVTRCSFEGVDFYSTCAYTYIFSDINLQHLGIDIWLDVPQIMGRQRLASNPFRFDATFFYKTLASSSAKTDPEFMAEISEKEAVTYEWIEMFNRSSKRLQDNMAKKQRKIQRSDKCADDYVTVIDDKVAGVRRVEFNELAMLNEVRAWDIRKNQYFDNCQVMTTIDDTTNTVVDDPVIKSFLQNFGDSFEQRLKLYCDTIDAHPECKDNLDLLPQVPIEIKRYYDALGPAVLRSRSYAEAKIKRQLHASSNKDSLMDATRAVFLPGQFYSLKQIKAQLSDIYEQLGIEKTAKASDLLNMDWLNARPAQGKVDGRKENGFKIL